MSTVRIINMKTGRPVKLETDAMTLEELLEDLVKQEEVFDGFDFSKALFYLKSSEGKKTIRLPEEKLPYDEEKYTLYIHPDKVDQGARYSKGKLKETRTIMWNFLTDVIGDDAQIGELVEDKHDDDNDDDLTPEERREIETLYDTSY